MIVNITLVKLFTDALLYLGALVIFVTLVTGLYNCVPRDWRDRFWNTMDRGGLNLFFVASWSMGFMVYCVGGYAEGLGIISDIFMSIIHATSMFLGQSNLSVIHEALHENVFYMFMFWLSHILALTCSLMFIIRQIGFFVVSRFKAWWKSLVGAKKENTYVFWGINDASLLLAENIRKEDKRTTKKESDPRIVFVRTHDDSERESESFNPSTIYDKIKIHRRELARLRKLNCLVISGNQRLSMLNMSSERDVLNGMLGLSSLRRIIKNKSEHTHIFIIGDDGDANVKATLNLLYDETIKNELNRIDIYCHSHRSARTRSLEYYGIMHRRENTDVHVIDTSHLSVSQLKLDVILHPVQHVSINKDATVDGELNAMIVGFGETGVEALKFLYEFGAFVGSDKRKTTFHCSIFDSQLKERMGLFISQTPFIKTCDEIAFYEYAVNTPEYWEIIQQNLIRSLNYIVVCPGSDNLALETVSNLCSMAIRHRTDESPRKLTICVRSYNQHNNTRLQDLCNDINDKYRMHGINVVPFGMKEQLFTYDNIVNNTLLRLAMQYNFSYNESPKGLSVKNVWYDSLGYKDSDSYSIDEIEEIERKREQNFSNALHAATKLYILDHCCSRKDIPDNIKENIARHEHERWVANMHINGWQRLQQPIANEDGHIQMRITIRKRHTDICPWEEIRKWDAKDQQRTRFYDYKVLETTLKLALTDNNN